MATPSLPAELVDQILGYVEDGATLAVCAFVTKSWLTFARRELYSSIEYWRPDEPEDYFGARNRMLFATLRSYPKLAALVTSLDFKGWYEVDPRLEQESDESEGEFEQRVELEGERTSQKDEKQLGQLLKCCTRIRCLRVKEAYLWLEDLVRLKDLVSITFDGTLDLRSRSGRPKMLRLPPVQHLSVTEPRTWFDADALPVDPLSVFVFPGLVHLRLPHLHGYYEDLDSVMVDLWLLAPQLQSLFVLGEPPEWRGILPLCTSLRQFSTDLDRPFGDSSLIHQLPPHLQLLEARYDTFGQQQPDIVLGKVVDAIVKAVESLARLRAVRFNTRMAPSDRIIVHLRQACERTGVSLRCGWDHRQGQQGELLVPPRPGEEELVWSRFSPTCEPQYD